MAKLFTGGRAGRGRPGRAGAAARGRGPPAGRGRGDMLSTPRQVATTGSRWQPYGRHEVAAAALRIASGAALQGTGTAPRTHARRSPDARPTCSRRRSRCRVRWSNAGSRQPPRLRTWRPTCAAWRSNFRGPRRRGRSTAARPDRASVDGAHHRRRPVELTAAGCREPCASCRCSWRRARASAVPARRQVLPLGAPTRSSASARLRRDR